MKKIATALVAFTTVATLTTTLGPGAANASTCTVTGGGGTSIYFSPSDSSSTVGLLFPGDKWNETWWTIEDGITWSQGNKVGDIGSGWVHRINLSC